MTEQHKGKVTLALAATFQRGQREDEVTLVLQGKLLNPLPAIIETTGKAKLTILGLDTFREGAWDAAVPRVALNAGTWKAYAINVPIHLCTKDPKAIAELLASQGEAAEDVAWVEGVQLAVEVKVRAANPADVQLLHVAWPHSDQALAPPPRKP